MPTRPPRRFLLRPQTYGRTLAWAALLIGLANMAGAIIVFRGAQRWNYFFGAMGWSAGAATLLSAKIS
jgi:hypothetical protein